MSGFLDTSMVVRYLTRDVPELAVRAAAIIDGAEDLLISSVVLTEADYMLRAVYLVPRKAVIDSLVASLSKQNLSCYGLEKGTALQALLMCRTSGRVSVADAMIWAAARTSGINIVYSFDERFPEDGVEARRGRG